MKPATRRLVIGLHVLLVHDRRIGLRCQILRRSQRREERHYRFVLRKPVEAVEIVASWVGPQSLEDRQMSHERSPLDRRPADEELEK